MHIYNSIRKKLQVAGGMSKRKDRVPRGTRFVVADAQKSPPSKSSVRQHRVCSRRGMEVIALVNQVGSSRARWTAARVTLTDVL